VNCPTHAGPWEHVLAFGGGIVFGNGVNSYVVLLCAGACAWRGEGMGVPALWGGWASLGRGGAGARWC